MKSNIKKERKTTSQGSRFKSRYARKNSNLIIYFSLLVVVIFIMATLIKPGHRKDSTNSDSSAVVSFTKEGELSFYGENGSEIVRIDIEIADDDPQREKGLMFRRTLDQLQGMLFIFGEAEFRSFWMKNTHLSLDIIYLDDQRKVIDIHENTPPYSEESIPSSAPAKYVVEVNAGFAAQYLLKIGDSVNFKRLY